MSGSATELFFAEVEALEDKALEVEVSKALAIARVEERVRAAVESAPPLPAELRTRLVELIRANTATQSVAPQPKTAQPRLAAEARETLRIAQLDEHIQRTAAALPDFTEEQRQRLAALLAPAVAAVAAKRQRAIDDPVVTDPELLRVKNRERAKRGRLQHRSLVTLMEELEVRLVDAESGGGE